MGRSEQDVVRNRESNGRSRQREIWNEWTPLPAGDRGEGVREKDGGRERKVSAVRLGARGAGRVLGARERRGARSVCEGTAAQGRYVREGVVWLGTSARGVVLRSPDYDAPPKKWSGTVTRSVVFSELDDSMHFLRHLRFCCLPKEATGGARYRGACVRVWRA